MTEPSSPRRTNLISHRFGVALTCALVSVLLLALPLPPTKGKWVVRKQDWVCGAAAVISVLSLVAYYVPSPLFPRRKSVWPLILFGTAVLVLGNVTWNKAYRAYASNLPRELRREVFRNALRTSFHSPVYGRYDNAIARYDLDRKQYSFTTLPFVIVSVAIAAAWYAWIRRRPMEKRWDAKALLLLMGFMIALIFAFALCEPWPVRLSLKISGYSEFAKDLRRFEGIGDTLRHYVERMPTLEWYGRHYPPGNLILLEIEKALGIPGLTKSIVVLCTALSIVPLYLLARELELDRRATSAALLMFAGSTSVLVLCTINTTSLLLLPGTMCLWLLVRAVRRDSIAAAVGLGVCFVVYLLLSFSASILGLLMALTVAFGWWRGAFTTRNVIKTGSVSIVVLVAVIALLGAATRFNLVACFIAAVHGHHEQQGNGGFDDPKRWLLRSTGNLLAYLMSTVPLCILAATAVMRRGEPRTVARALILAVAASLVVAAFSGLFYVETERIWIFLTPMVALAAGYELARRAEEQDDRRLIGRVFLLVLLISCTQEFLFMHYR